MAADVDFSKTTKSILSDFIRRCLRTEGYQWGEFPRYQNETLMMTTRKLRKMADFKDRNELKYASMMEQLRITSDTLHSKLEQISKQLLLEDVNVNRLSALFYFGQSIVGKIAELGTPEMAHTLVKWMQEYVKKYLKSWIIRKGGWVQCIRHFAKEPLQLILTPYRIIFHILCVIALLLAVILHTSPCARVKMKYGVGTTSEATKLIIWVCGDVELNPGPGNSRSEILRKFRKSQQSSLLIILYEKFGDGTVPKSLYKEVPTWWPTDIPFVNITNHKKEDESVACFSKGIEMLKQSVFDLSSDWTVILKHYSDLLHKCGDTNQLDFCKDKLLEWMGSKKIEKALDAVDTSSFMDDLRLKLKVLEDMANQGEAIPADIAAKVSAIHRSINISKGKRKIEPEKEDLSHLPKKRKSDSNDGTLNAQPANLCVSVTDQLANQPQYCSEKFCVEKDSVSSWRTDFNHPSISASSRINTHSNNITRKAIIENKAPENNDSKSVVVSSHVHNGLSETGDTSSSLRLPSDLLNTILSENVDNDIINNFDLDLLELSDEDISVVF